MDQRLRATKTAVLLRDACQRHRDGQRRDAVAERLRRPTMCERGHRSKAHETKRGRAALCVLRAAPGFAAERGGGGVKVGAARGARHA